MFSKDTGTFTLREYNLTIPNLDGQSINTTEYNDYIDFQAIIQNNKVYIYFEEEYILYEGINIHLNINYSDIINAPYNTFIYIGEGYAGINFYYYAAKIK